MDWLLLLVLIYQDDTAAAAAAVWLFVLYRVVAAAAGAEQAVLVLVVVCSGQAGVRLHAQVLNIHIPTNRKARSLSQTAGQPERQKNGRTDREASQLAARAAAMAAATKET